MNTDITHAGNGQQMTRGSEGAVILDAILQAAQNPAMDVDKLKSLFDLQERMQDRQAAQAYAAAMVDAQSEMRAVGKDRTNTQTNSDYATLEAIDAAIRPIYTRNGFSLSFGTADSPLEKHVRITCKVTHRDGHSESFEYDNPMDDVGIAGKVNKTPTHARGSAVTYGRRYLTLMIFNLTTGLHDDDGNGATSEPEPAYLDWHDAIRGAFSADELREVKKEMAGKFGADKVPPVLVRAYNARLAEVRA